MSCTTYISFLYRYRVMYNLHFLPLSSQCHVQLTRPLFIVTMSCTTYISSLYRPSVMYTTYISFLYRHRVMYNIRFLFQWITASTVLLSCLRMFSKFLFYYVIRVSWPFRISKGASNTPSNLRTG